MACTCRETQRCAEAHALRDAYQAARVLDERITHSKRYTEHLSRAGLIAYPTTTAPTWQCATACAPDAPCRKEVTAYWNKENEDA